MWSLGGNTFRLWGLVAWVWSLGGNTCGLWVVVAGYGQEVVIAVTSGGWGHGH